MPNVIVRARYKQDNSSFGRFMKSQQMKQVANQAATAIAENAASLAREEAMSTGAYARAFKVNRRQRNLSFRGNLRAASAVYNNDPAAPGQEFGDRWGNKGKRILLKAGAPFHTAKRGR